ncbi:MAG: Trk system potassium transporter TrkA [Saprospiraceae bacterium]|nr:Trk system potassium transporter TrkA [Saprospiraceae bacterium]
MKIIIAGAGAIGFHLANLLSKENQSITLIDIDEEVLFQASRHLDVMTIQGDISSIDILEQANIKKTQLFIAVTTSESTNLLSAMLAKQLGAKNTIARISAATHLKKDNKKRLKQMGVDVMISPQRLAALEIERLLRRASFTDLFEFENGRISIVGFTIDSTCPILNYTIKEVNELTRNFTFRGIALLRGYKTIIPEESTVLKKGDHLYISTQNQFLEEAMKFIGKQLRPIKKVMIIGGTPLALKTAQLIEHKYSVTIVMEDEEQAKRFVEQLNKCLVINADPGNIDALKEEGFAEMDAFIALTPNSETNIISSLMAEDIGVYKTIALVENVDYTHISQNIGIDTIINKKLITANNIFRFVRKGKVQAIASLHGVDAEIIEYEIHKRNRLINNTIEDLHFPKKSIIAGIVRGDQSIIPSRDFKLEIGDKVIILALPEAIHQVEEIFK